MKIVISITILAILSITSLSFAAKEVPYTLDDRDRLIRVETKIEGLEKRFDALQTFMLWGFGILFGGMGLLIGFVIWDRRSALAPAIKKNKELEEREEKIEKALKEFSTKNPDLAEALKHVGL